jgi:hypothetical protein
LRASFKGCVAERGRRRRRWRRWRRRRRRRRWRWKWRRWGRGEEEALLLLDVATDTDCIGWYIREYLYDNVSVISNVGCT